MHKRGVFRRVREEKGRWGVKLRLNYNKYTSRYDREGFIRKSNRTADANHPLAFENA